ncbi:ladderlectin-like [Labeo rohita]|uniref:ladderlectin-like n=1 Tax=Labeo rohita TaxID=84645 RepID=UPI0021E348AE|nr:ladderlectin-like [Labeo rohita]
MWIPAAFLLFALVVNGDWNEERFGRRTGRRCPSGWEKFETRCFKFFNDSKTWAEAERQCIDLGGNLVSVHNQATHNFLKNFLKNANGIRRTWIGAYDATQENIWFWSDGSPFAYSNWQTGEPNNSGGAENCVEMGNSAHQRWNDAHCSALLNFICKLEIQN